MPDGGPAGERMPAVNDADGDLAPLLAQAGILMFEYDVDGFLLRASGSCLGASDPATEIRAGLVTPAVARLAAAGQTVVDEVRVADRTITVRHEPVLGECGETVRIVATAYDMTYPSRRRSAGQVGPALLRSCDEMRDRYDRRT